MDWLLSIVRVAGASFPVASSLVQLNSEIESKALLQRVAKLEDPISHLHEQVPELSKHIYQKIKETNSNSIEFADNFYKEYSRPLAALESQKFIKGCHAIGKQFAAGLRVVDPSYIMYMCALTEEAQKMEALINKVDSCWVGKWINGVEIHESLNIPLPVAQAVFEIYEDKGYGLCSKTIGEYKYMGKA
ncbi:hypothetical protein [Pseudothauera lacus]|uniref:hypothetical protein n=1 Tax=Pseudothauera lacus TaxID=2136175 RepID=UPI0011B1F033|nr:hypothetical protein [Pseudothauera lacus]